MILAVPLLLGAATCAAGACDGGPGWLNLLVILLIWDALKLLVMGPVSVGVLLRQRWAEHRAASGSAVE